MNETAVKKLRKMNAIGKKLSITSTILNILVIVGVILFLLFPATCLVYDIGKYADGYNYYGWQLAIMGMGYPPVSILCMFEEASTVAGDLIPNQYDFTTNALLLIAIILPIVAIIVTSIVRGRVKNTGKAICNFTLAAVLIFSAIVFLCVTGVSAMTATDDLSKMAFKSTYLTPAMKDGTYYTLLYPVLLGIVCIVVAVFKAARGAFLLYQKSYAVKNLNK